MKVKNHCCSGKTLSAFLKLFALLVIFTADAAAQGVGDLLVTPTRVLFEGSKRNENITLMNIGSDTAAYTISFVQYRMTEDGGFKEITEPESGELFADEMVRYYPRQVTLAPSESQIVRLQFSKPENLTDGEYRSHLYFRSVPKPRPLEELVDTATTTFSVQLTPVYGVSIPVIIRQGKLNASLTLDSLEIVQMEDNKPALRLRMNRSGNKSLYGDFTVTMISDGKSEAVGEAKGVAIYPSISSRVFQILLQFPGGRQPASGKLVVEFKSRSDLEESIISVGELVIQ